MPEIIQSYLNLHVALAPVIAVILRTISVILAPFPGTPLDLINIAFFGNFYGFLYAEIGIVIGSLVNFYVGRKFREPIMEKFISLEKISIWEKRIAEKTGFWGLTLIRMITIPVFDYLSYVAGLTKMSFWKFFMSSLLSSIPPMALFYYLGGTFLEREFYLAIILIAPLVLIYSMFQKGKIFKRFSDYINAR